MLYVPAATQNLSESLVFVSFNINIDDVVILFTIIINISQKCVLQSSMCMNVVLGFPFLD